MGETKKTGTLYLVSTPIGNLKDITYRAVETLSKVSLIAAEDTRHTRKLLHHYTITTNTVSYHDHNKVRGSKSILKVLMGGGDVALVSDAGTPGISDPGYYLVNRALESGLRVTACPGPCAAVMALSISGLPTDSFSFYGFVPTKTIKRKNFLKTLANENKSMVFYESSGRIKSMLQDVYEVLGNRRVVVSRELTKMFEETIRGSLDELLKDDLLTELKGELVVIVSKRDKQDKASIDELSDEILRLLGVGATVKDVSSTISEKYAISKKEVYDYCIKVLAHGT